MELSQYLNFDFLIRFLEGLQKFLGDHCEIIIHDYRKGYDHTIVYALNARVSGREVGGSPHGGMITQFGKDIEPYRQSIQYFDTSQKDHFFKSCTTLIEDENHKIVGSVCLNMDVSDLFLAQNALQAFLQYPAASSPSLASAASASDTASAAESASSEAFILKKNVDEIVQHYMQQAESLVGKPMSLMNKEEKVKALDYLDQKGVFKISKTSLLLCEALQISKYTLYSYLDEARNSRSSEII